MTETRLLYLNRFKLQDTPGRSTPSVSAESVAGVKDLHLDEDDYVKVIVICL